MTLTSIIVQFGAKTGNIFFGPAFHLLRRGDLSRSLKEETRTFSAQLLEFAEMDEPKVEQIFAKLKKLRQGNRGLEEEIQDIESVSESLKKQLDALDTDFYQLEVIHKEKKELRQKLLYQSEDSEQDLARQIKVNKSSEELLGQYIGMIQAIKLKHQKLRIQFENELSLLIQQQKNLFTVFMPDRLPAEIEGAENTKDQLIFAEKLKRARVSSLEEELQKMKKQVMLAVVAEEE